MSRKGRITALLAVVMLLVGAVWPLSASANTVDTSKKGSVTVSYTDGELPLAGAAFDLFLVATVNAQGAYTVTPAFSGYNVVPDIDDLETLAFTLEGYVLRDEILPTADGVTDQAGQLCFDTLTCGMYLVVGYHHTQGEYLYATKPFIVLLPNFDPAEGVLEYAVTVQPKKEVSPLGPDQTVTRKVLKVWDDNGNKTSRPKQIEIQLLCEGKLYDTVILNADNNWRHTWQDLPADRHFTVTEKTVKGYTVKVSLEGITYVVTNTAKETTPPTTKPTKPGDKLPQTGQLWWPVYLLAAVGLLCLVIGFVCRRGGRYEA